MPDLLELVDLRPNAARLFPHEFSGGQRQRLAARTLSTNARLVVLDEPVSALDVPIRAHIISLLERISAQLAVSHPLQTAVMNPGRDGGLLKDRPGSTTNTAAARMAKGQLVPNVRKGAHVEARGMVAEPESTHDARHQKQKSLEQMV